MELTSVRLLVFAPAKVGWLSRLNELVERHKPSLVCLLDDSLDESAASELASLSVDNVFVTSALTHTSKVGSLRAGPCRVGPLVLVGLSCAEGAISQMLASLLPAGTPGLLVWLSGAHSGKAQGPVQVVVVSAEAGRSFAFQSWRGRWGDAALLRLRSGGQSDHVSFAFNHLAGEFLAMSAEVAP